MTGPANVNPRSLVRGLDDMLTAGGQGWEALEKLFQPAMVPDPWRPDDQLLKQIAAFYQTELGRRFFDWLFDLTVRAPYPHTGDSIEATALAAAKHEARAAVGETVLQAIAEGRRLLDANS